MFQSLYAGWKRSACKQQSCIAKLSHLHFCDGKFGAMKSSMQIGCDEERFPPIITTLMSGFVPYVCLNLTFHHLPSSTWTSHKVINVKRMYPCEDVELNDITTARPEMRQLMPGVFVSGGCNRVDYGTLDARPNWVVKLSCGM